LEGSNEENTSNNCVDNPVVYLAYGNHGISGSRIQERKT
jgi:hypothetical protein